MTATAGATRSHDITAPMAGSVLAREEALTAVNRSAGRHSAHLEHRGSTKGVSPVSREPRSNGTATLLRQTVGRQQRLRLSQPARPASKGRGRRLLEGVKRNLVNLFASVEWTKVGAFVTAVGAVVTIFISARSVGATLKQNSLSARSQLSDRFNKAIGYLDSKKNATDVVVGGIYLLEQLTQDPLSDNNLRTVVIDVLDTYVVDHPPEDCSKLAPPSPDVKAALTVIGRRKFDKQIDLSSACLNGADLRGALLENAWLQSATLTQATLSGANLASADLSNAVLTNSYLGKSDKGKKTNLKQATLVKAHLNHANMTGANLTDVNLTGADLTGTNLSGADLTGANLNNICYESSPRWPEGFIPPPSSNLQCGML